MHRKKIGALLLVCLMSLSVLAGCMGSGEEEKTTAEKTTKAPVSTAPATTLPPGTTKPPATTADGQANGNLTEQMLNKIRGLQGITKANALVMGDTAWIWLEHSKEDDAAVKTLVETEVKGSFDSIREVRIITDKTVIGRLEEISGKLKENGRIEDYKDELDQIK